MPTDLQGRSQYLVLAEFCQELIDSVSDYLEGKAELPRKTLERAVEALQAVKKGDLYRFGQRPAAALGSFEQMRTLKQVFNSPTQVDGALAVISALLTETPEDHANAQAVIELFAKLQTKALWNFEQPTPAAAPDISELWNAFKTA
jgi:hypothetical protein